MSWQGSATSSLRISVPAAAWTRKWVTSLSSARASVAPSRSLLASHRARTAAARLLPSEAWHALLAQRRAVTGPAEAGSSLVMMLVEDRERWVALVGAAQRGDATAWPALIDRFEDIALASAVGLCGDLHEAPDIAQEAFVLAFRHIGGLEDPAAFPAWLLRLVRTATTRRARRRRFAMVPLDPGPGYVGEAVLLDPAAGAEEVVLAAVEAAGSGPRSSACPRVNDVSWPCTTWPGWPTWRSPPSSASPYLPPKSGHGPPALD